MLAEGVESSVRNLLKDVRSRLASQPLQPPQTACPSPAIPGAAPYLPRAFHGGWGPRVLPGEGRASLLLPFVPRESEISPPLSSL